jgi:hypothetical protein
MMRRAFFTEASVSKEKRASTSVETFPGTILRISLPNWTSRLSRVQSTSFLDAARMSDGLVVASWGLYLSMVAKSPESQTTVYAC